ncbi:hypothetical protein LJC60_08625 [Ruminococcaceae bacterium OttesenSCG-928-D13]|nr:hypothetical protein [Ruminococcaceae bacterium OttesenSCG-928-D13]
MAHLPDFDAFMASVNVDGLLLNTALEIAKSKTDVLEERDLEQDMSHKELLQICTQTSLSITKTLLFMYHQWLQQQLAE